MATVAKKSAAATARIAKAVEAVAEGRGELYEVLSTLHHDGKPYHEGDVIALDAVQAEPLLPIGVVRLAPAAPKAPAA